MIYVVHPDKIAKYLLDATSEFGAPKARFFIAKGFSLRAPELFDLALKRHPLEASLAKIEVSAKGRKLVFDCDLATPSGPPVCIRSVWIEDPAAQTMRLITAYPSNAGGRQT